MKGKTNQEFRAWMGGPTGARYMGSAVSEAVSTAELLELPAMMAAKEAALLEEEEASSPVTYTAFSTIDCERTVE